MVTDARRSTATCPARAALAGNPSDGYGGAVTATVIPAIGATVTVTDAERFVVDGLDHGWEHHDDLDAHLDLAATTDQPLVPATLIALRRHLDVTLDPLSIDVATTIPRAVGLGGSSAIVLATIRAVVAHHSDRGWAADLATDRSLTASLALAVERDVLGIAAGLQDRVVQSFGRTMAMEFGDRHRRTIAGLVAGSYRPVGPLPANMFVACRPEYAGDSGAVHSAHDPSDHRFSAAMASCADEGRRAAEAIEAGDRTALGAAMDTTFDRRASVMALDAAHVEMIELARLHDASANYSGSGGAIVVLPRDPRTAHRVRSALIDRLGCVVFDLPPG